MQMSFPARLTHFCTESVVQSIRLSFVGQGFTPAGYSERLFGETHWTIIAVGVWGWPVMSWSVGSGFLGLLTVPYALAASVIVLSHVNVIVCFLVSWLPACLRAAWWPPGLTIRVLSFAWTAGYLYCKAYLPPLSRGLFISLSSPEMYQQ